MDGSEVEEYEPGKIFVGGLSWNTTEESMRAYFSQFGAVADCVVMKDKYQDANLKRNRGFGFITFEDPAAVDSVVNPQVTHTLDEKRIDPKKAQKKSGVKDTDKKVFVGGLASSTKPEQVQEYFSTNFGGVVEVVFKFDNQTQRKRGFGFVVFESSEYVAKVLQSQYHEIDGKKVEVKKAEPRSATASAQRMNPATMGYYPAQYPGPDYSAANGQYGGQWGPTNGQYYNTSYPPPPPHHPHPGYGPQYNTGGNYQYSHSGYPRTQTSTGERPPADPHQSYYQTQHTYGQHQAGGGGVGYGQENGGGYSQGRGGGFSGSHGGYGQHAGGYGRGGEAAMQQQRPFGAGGFPR